MASTPQEPDGGRHCTHGWPERGQEPVAAGESHRDTQRRWRPRKTCQTSCVYKGLEQQGWKTIQDVGSGTTSSKTGSHTGSGVISDKV